MTIQASKLTIQRWGNSLAVRIPATVARRLRFEIGTPVELIMQEDGVTVHRIGDKMMTLDERLARFDSVQHGGEVMSPELIGQERFE